MTLYQLVRSKNYKNFMAKLYGIGAAVVIAGALFKILHWPGADIMLMVGMLTESVIFFASAFEPLHVEYNWALVYPELAVGHEDEIEPKSKKKDLPKGNITQQLDVMLEQAKVGPELIESLATGMRNLAENAKKISGTADATSATDTYVSSLVKAGESARNLTLQYDKTASALSSSYDAQAKSNEVIVESYKKMEQSVKAYADTLTSSLEQTIKYKEEVDKLTKNVAQISNIYGNMLAAMGGK
ncbi:MAG: gliding motility protein GldL [Bacteroidales bacterium]|jgi:gliding motility-associated protein GldL|nr:gliding motility protein GldL [Bacteroidales bacterium]